MNMDFTEYDFVYLGILDILFIVSLPILTFISYFVALRHVLSLE